MSSHLAQEIAELLIRSSEKSEVENQAFEVKKAEFKDRLSHRFNQVNSAIHQLYEEMNDIIAFASSRK